MRCVCVRAGVAVCVENYQCLKIRSDDSSHNNNAHAKQSKSGLRSLMTIASSFG